MGKDGSRKEAGLRDVLLNAHLLQSIDDPLPTVEFGLYRLLTAFVLDIFELEGEVSLVKLIETGKFDETKVNSYFDKYAERFDLFDEKHPFLQSGGMEKENAKPLAGLLPSIPSGTNAGHFHHSLEEEFGVSPAVAARLLAIIAPFMTAGGAGLSPSINGAPPWYVLLSRPGGTLFETLCLNTFALEMTRASVGNPPSWRDNRPVTSERRTSASLLESLTWQPRRIQLIPGKGGLCSLTCKHYDTIVRSMKFAPGFASGFEPAWRDPAVPYRISKEGPIPMRPQEGREVWRDTGAIAFLKQGEKTHERPALIDQFEGMMEQIFNKTPEISLTLYGMRTDMKMKVFEWHRERLNLPVQLIWRKRMFQNGIDAMEKSESVAYSLKLAIKHTYPRDGKGNSKAFDTLIAQTSQQFWGALRNPYDELLREIAPLSPEKDKEAIFQKEKKWENSVREVSNIALDSAIDDFDTDGDAMRRCVEARAQLNRKLWFTFATLEQKQIALAKSKAKKGETPK